jgi:ATP-dependent Clp protease protease subunit
MNKTIKNPLVPTDELFEVLDARKIPKAAARVAPENRLPRFDPVNAAGDGKKRAAIHLLDAVSWWSGNDARTFQRTLADLDAEEIDLYINSPGGSVFEGVTIYNLLVAHPAKINVHVLGLAASIASVIALAGDTVEIAENAMFMIHDPSSIAMGKAEDFRRTAEVLDKITESILNTYEARTKMSRDELRAAMAAETYFTADESVSWGFATSKVAGMRAAALWNPEDFEGLPEAARALAFHDHPPTPSLRGAGGEEWEEEGGDGGEGSGAGDAGVIVPVESLETVSAAEAFLNSIREGLEDALD